jgi:hypothetical protein
MKEAAMWNEDGHRVVAAFEDRADADGAVRALDRAGLGRATISEQRVAAVRRIGGTRAPTEGNADAAAKVGLSAGTGALLGAVIGAIAGLVLVALFGPDGAVFLGAGGAGGAAVGGILGMVAAGVSAADRLDHPAGDDAGYESSERGARTEVLVVVDAPDQTTAGRAASLLAGMAPLRIDRYAPGGRRLSA